MPRRRQYDEPIIMIKLRRGLAERRRLPLEHVTKVLEEFRHMINEIANDVEQDLGIDRGVPITINLEILADSRGRVFRGGSLHVPIAITSNIHAGVLAAQRVVKTVNTLQRIRNRPRSVDRDELDYRVLRRLNRIADVQELDKTELQIAISTPTEGNGRRTQTAKTTFNQAAMDTIRTFQEPIFAEEGLTIYGKLYELKDRSKAEEAARWLWGELRRENGEIWRLQFKQEDAAKITSLFARQVSATGKAIYYRVQAPKLVVDGVSPDEDRDYEKAFEELYGCDRAAYGNTDLETLLKRMHGEK